MDAGVKEGNVTEGNGAEGMLMLPQPTPERLKEHKEQARTTINKKIVLEFMEQTRGVVEHACKRAEINKRTFYRWRASDPAFAAALQDIAVTRMEEVEDLLLGKIFIEKNLRAITYWLDRKHPGYKPSVTEVVTGAKTLEDVLREAGETEKNEEDEQGAYRGASQDQG